MERRRKVGSTAAARGLSTDLVDFAADTLKPLGHIEAVVNVGGQIMIGTLQPIKGAAVAHDGQKTLVMLKRKKDEPIPALLARLDAAIADARSTGKRVDEINQPDSDVTYSY